MQSKGFMVLCQPFALAADYKNMKSLPLNGDSDFQRKEARGDTNDKRNKGPRKDNF